MFVLACNVNLFHIDLAGRLSYTSMCVCTLHYCIFIKSCVPCIRQTQSTYTHTLSRIHPYYFYSVALIFLHFSSRTSNRLSIYSVTIVSYSPLQRYILFLRSALPFASVACILTSPDPPSK